ncbi:hypothetical protein FHS59_003142 [Algoriphagus iocasae]|jgi:hypothetical protein|uniref:Uncharacterized protein n=1 Tax=Algoriphagus iocasae TaxID=1836499 RepID=A0A841MPJ8_9BACT|nr:hypothetical protein [Algoriphagus iocasae]MBB6327499.1 hypothetical protein [Algoriphagus iocasae]
MLFSGALSLLAQDHFPSQIWHNGTIYGIDGNTYAGLVKYDLENNVVQLQTETISTFTASNVSHFEIHNNSNDGKRSFYSLPYDQNGENETLIFFEVLSEGNDIALLSREYILTYYKDLGTKGVIGMNPRNGPKTFTGYRLAFNYYFFKNGKIEPYSLNPKDLYTMLPGHDEEIKHFMRKNGLDHDKRRDLMRITAYYNELQN